MVKKEISPDEVKKATEKFADSLKSANLNLKSIDSILEYFISAEKQIEPLYERFKKISDICDKIDLIDNTMIRLGKYQAMFEKFSKDSSFSHLFQ